MREVVKWFLPRARARRRVVRDRAKLLRLIPTGGVGVEVGVWTGGWSLELLTRRPRELHLVDPWSFQPDYEGRFGTGGQEKMDRVYAEAVENVGGKPGVTIHRATSMEAVERFEDGWVDWVYVDGDHREESVAADLRAWARKLAPGGLLMGDDYDDDRWDAGVRKAVDAFAAETGWSLETIRSQFVLRRC